MIEPIISTNGAHPLFISPYTDKRYPLITAEIALQRRPPLEWTVAGLLQPSSLAMIVGRAGIGKTYAALDMAVAVAMGKPWLGKETAQTPVLIVDEESGERRISDRLGAVLRGHGAGPDTPITAVSFGGFNLTTDEGVVELEAIIQHVGAGLVVIDALADVAAGADENSVKEMLPTLILLRQIAESTKACVSTLHHTSKLGEYRGSTAIVGKVDVMLKMDREASSNRIDFSFTKARDVQESSFAAFTNHVDDTFWLSPADTAAKNTHMTRGQAYVMEYLAQHPNATVKEIKDHADVCSPDTARLAVYDLAKLKLIRRTDEGGNGQTATYIAVKTNDRQVGGD